MKQTCKEVYLITSRVKERQSGGRELNEEEDYNEEKEDGVEEVLDRRIDVQLTRRLTSKGPAWRTDFTAQAL